MKSYEQVKKDRLKIIGLLVLCFAALIFLVPASDAKVNPNSTLSVVELLDTKSSITWSYNYTVLLTYASLDGTTIEGFDLKSVNYTAHNLEPETLHEFCINSNTGRNCEIGHTSAHIVTSEEEFWDFLMYYILLFVTLILLLIGFKIPLGSVIAFFFAFTGLLLAITARDFNMIIMFVCCLTGSSIVTYIGVKK
jgi:small-conductance mechanosensitive channel